MIRALIVAGLVAVSAGLTQQNASLREAYREQVRSSYGPRPGDIVPAGIIPTSGGGLITVGQERRPRAQVLLVYTTTCSFCARSIPAWRRLAAGLAHMAPDERPDLIGVALPPHDSVAKYANLHGLDFPTVLPSPRWAAQLRLRVVPAVVIADSSATIRYVRLGVLQEPAAVDSIIAAVGRVVARGRPVRMQMR